MRRTGWGERMLVAYLIYLFLYLFLFDKEMHTPRAHVRMGALRPLTVMMMHR